MNNRVRTWWHVKKPGEKRAIVTLSIIILAIFYWYGFVLPVEQRIQALHMRCQKLQTDRQWLDNQVNAAGLLPEKAPGEKLQSQLESQLKKEGIIAILTTTPEGSIDVSASRLEPATLVHWLNSLQSRQGLRIYFLEFHALDDSSITLTRMRAGGQKHGG